LGKGGLDSKRMTVVAFKSAENVATSCSVGKVLAKSGKVCSAKLFCFRSTFENISGTDRVGKRHLAGRTPEFVEHINIVDAGLPEGVKRGPSLRWARLRGAGLATLQG